MDRTKDKLNVELKVLCGSRDSAKEVKKIVVSAFSGYENLKVWTDRKVCRISVNAKDILTSGESPFYKIKRKLMNELAKASKPGFEGDFEINKIFVWLAWVIEDI